MVRFSSMMLVALILALLFGLAGPAQAEEAQGKVMAVNAEKNQLVIQDVTGKEMKFQVEMRTKILLNSKEVQLSDLHNGDDAAIRYEPQEDILMAVEISCKR
jgi:hypothetical protein